MHIFDSRFPQHSRGTVSSHLMESSCILLWTLMIPPQKWDYRGLDPSVSAPISDNSLPSISNILWAAFLGCDTFYILTFHTSKPRFPAIPSRVI